MMLNKTYDLKNTMCDTHELTYKNGTTVVVWSYLHVLWTDLVIGHYTRSSIAIFN